MTSRSYILSTLGAIVMIALLLVGFSVMLDPYSLFVDASGKRLVSYNPERRAKYLLSQNYIPTNFEGVLLGPSLSDNMPTGRAKDLKLYNLSLNGGNISELRVLLDNVLVKTDLRYVIICMDPYITKDFDPKTDILSRKTFWGALGSIESLRDNLLVSLGRMDVEADAYGYQNLEERQSRRKDPEIEKLRKEFIDVRKGAIPIHPQALSLLKDTLRMLRERGVRIFAYYFPNFKDFEANLSGSYKLFRETTRPLFKPNDIVWDYNVPDYAWFTGDRSYYFDGRHLSRKGESVLMDDIARRVRSTLSESE